MESIRRQIKQPTRIKIEQHKKKFFLFIGYILDSVLYNNIPTKHDEIYILLFCKKLPIKNCSPQNVESDCYHLTCKMPLKLCCSCVYIRTSALNAIKTSSFLLSINFFHPLGTSTKLRFLLAQSSISQISAVRFMSIRLYLFPFWF